MGLIKAAASAIGSTMHDQWKEAIRCENMTMIFLWLRKLLQMELYQTKVQL